MSYTVPDPNDTNSPIKRHNIYLKMNGNEFVVDKNNTDSMEPSTRFFMQAAGAFDNAIHQNRELLFFTNFLQTFNPTSRITTIHSINDSARNPLKESHIRSFSDSQLLAADNNSTLNIAPYRPEYVDQNGQYKESEYQNQYRRDGTPYSVPNRSRLTSIRPSTIYQCKSQCESDPDCQNFYLKKEGQ